ncbi:MAG: hypothetical protein DRP62_04650 [Planctomycetota bacterium]|nr:MAG: hypothetical protein DRP62_04650 [Planctomycetota bacterium]
MASGYGSVWAIDIGNNSLKALRLNAEGGAVEVIGFDNIQHGKILSGSNVTEPEKDELIAISLRQFVTQNDLGADDIVISVPSQNSFARFVNLPPVEQKRIPEIVKFEAAQQIPFDISEVQWDWQLMTEPGSSETRVGIFAIKSDIVASELEHFSRENITVGYVQMAPMALYNYVLHDRDDLGDSDEQGFVVLDIGAESTDLVVCTRATVWQRSIPIGGNAFTTAIADAFKLNFEKAEKLKRTAAMSKYARQIFQAMRPIFTDLASEVQRSLGFYNSSNPNTKLSKVIAFGGGAKMRGLLKYLQQTLQMPVERPDSFRNLAISPNVSAAKFHENVGDFGIVYGLGLQALGLAKIESNLLPRSIARSMTWASKAKYFTTAALILLLTSILCFSRTYLDKVKYDNNDEIRQEVINTNNAAMQAIDKLKVQKNRGPGYDAMIENEFELFKYRDVVPLLQQTIISTLPNEKNNPTQKTLYEAFKKGDVETVVNVPRKERKQIFVTSMSVYFTNDIERATFGGGTLKKSKRRRRDYSEAEMMGPGMMPGMPGMMNPEFMPPGYGKKSKSTPRKSRKSRRRSGKKKQDENEKKSGFVVTLTGYSPYKAIGELLDPAGVENKPDEWGVVTRLLHLDALADGNSPFELYKRTDVEHFILETGEVDLSDPEMPDGIGLKERKKGKGRNTSELVLVDPMTKEIISKTAKLDDDGKKIIDYVTGDVIYEVNDHWFELDVKFIWKDAPVIEED